AALFWSFSASWDRHSEVGRAAYHSLISRHARCPTPVASSSRMPPSQPRASGHSRALAWALRPVAAVAAGAAFVALGRGRRELWRQPGGNPSPLIAALAAASDLTILHPRGVLRRLGKLFFCDVHHIACAARQLG